MEKLFVGREKEQQQLKDYINSDQSEFIAVYGRRRVGKTFLIQQVIGNDYAFYVAGMNNVSLRIQLSNFMQGIRKKCPDIRPVKLGSMRLLHWKPISNRYPKGAKLSS